MMVCTSEYNILEIFIHISKGMNSFLLKMLILIQVPEVYDVCSRPVVRVHYDSVTLCPSFSNSISFQHSSWDQSSHPAKHG